MAEVSDNSRFQIRLRFQKIGDLKFISHLDLMRTMRRAFHRAQIPLAYSCGFNPHPKMTFALPLSLGSESICEYMDITVTEELEYEQIKSRCNAVLPEELQITDVRKPVCGLDKIGFSDYEIRIKPLCTERGFENAFADYIKAPVYIEKQSKSGVKTIDITERIHSASFIGDRRRNVFVRVEPAGQKRTFLLRSRHIDILKPQMFLAALGMIFQSTVCVSRRKALVVQKPNTHTALFCLR